MTLDLVVCCELQRRLRTEGRREEAGRLGGCFLNTGPPLSDSGNWIGLFSDSRRL